MITSIPTKNQTFTSAKGVPVNFSLYLEKDCEQVQTVELRYNTGGKGKEFWVPFVPRCYQQILEVINYFIEDKSSRGNSFKELSLEHLAKVSAAFKGERERKRNSKKTVK